MSKPVIVPAGDQALRVIFENKIDPGTNLKVTSLDERLVKKEIKGIRETIPAFRTLTVLFDGTETDFETLSVEIRRLLTLSEKTIIKKKRIIEIPVCYDEAFGIDLKDVAEHAGITVQEVIQLHSERDYLIYMLGFLPGFAYLGGLDPILSMPRLDTPRLNIAAGAVGIAGNQTGMYPMDSPGGWRVIGSTPVRLFDAGRDTPFLYEAGDYIRFRPVSKDDYETIRKKSAENAYQCHVMMEDESIGHTTND